MTSVDLVIQSNRIVRSYGVHAGAVAVKDGKIVALTDVPYPGAASQVIDASELIVLPGLIDPHTHMRDPGLTEAEDWLSGTRAAAAGGVTTILEHPNTIPPSSTVAGFITKKEIASSKAIVDFGLIAGAGEDNLAEIEGLAAAGAVAYKTFTLPGSGANLAGCTALDDGMLYEIFRAVASTGRPHNVHAESYRLIRHFKQALAKQGRIQPTEHGASRPVISEVEAFMRVMALAGATGVRLNFVHASSASAVDHVLPYRRAGLVNVTIETCPHYLLLTEERMAAVGPYAKVNPPLRSEAERVGLWNHLVAGHIDTIGSDHAPHPYAAIERGWDNILTSPGGSPGLEFMLPALLTQVEAGNLNLTSLARLTSENVARLYGLYPRKGTLEVGSDADLVVVDPTIRRTAVPSGLYTKDPRIARMWEGYVTTGAPIMTIVRGHIVMRDGEVIGQPGHGLFIAPVG